MYLMRTKNRRGLRRGGLGAATMVNGSLVWGSSPITARPPIRVLPGRTVAVAHPVRAVGPAYPVNVPETTAAPTTTPAPWTPPWANGGYGGRGNGSGYGNGYGGGYGGSGWNAASSPYGSQPNSTALATAQALLSTNPSLLTQQQWTMLQAAGLVSTSLPYGSASLVNPTAGTAAADTSAIDPATGIPYATELATAEAGSTSDIGTTLSATYAGLPLYLWLVIGGGAALLLTRSGGRR